MFFLNISPFLLQNENMFITENLKDTLEQKEKPTDNTYLF